MRHLTRSTLAAYAITVLLINAALAQGIAPMSASAASPPIATPPDGKGRAPAGVEQHMAEMRRRLAITAAQQPQWDAFVGVMRQNAQRMQAAYADRSARAAGMNAVDGMRSYADLARARADDLQRLVPAFEALYSVMSPEQKLNADKTIQQFQTRSERRGAQGR